MKKKACSENSCITKNKPAKSNDHVSACNSLLQILSYAYPIFINLRCLNRLYRDREATLRLDGGGGVAPLVTRYWGGGAQDTFLVKILKILGGHVLPPATPAPRSQLHPCIWYFILEII